jgi:hypothetical protein
MTSPRFRIPLAPALLLIASAALLSAASMSLAVADSAEWRASQDELPRLRAAVPSGAVDHILVIDLENESFTATFGPTSPATYLNSVLLKQGELIDNYFATGHASLDNYISQISAQSPNGVTKADCSNLASLSPPFTGIQFEFIDVAPGVDDPFPATNPGQVDGQGCVYPAPGPASGAHGAPTITDQIDAKFRPDPQTHIAAWRDYDEDMGNNPVRDGGVPDRSGGTDCAHPPIGGVDTAEIGTAIDQYATRLRADLSARTCG